MRGSRSIEGFIGSTARGRTNAGGSFSISLLSAAVITSNINGSKNLQVTEKPCDTRWVDYWRLYSLGLR